MNNVENTNTTQPFQNLNENSQYLREKALFANKQAQTQVDRARKANEDITNLDVQGLFQQLHEMVELFGGTARPVESMPIKTRLAAE